MTRNCPACGEPVPETARKCGICGHDLTQPVETTKPCPECNGTGKLDYIQCPRCGGSGLENCPTCHGTGKCHRCDGTGVESGGSKCWFCKGLGGCKFCMGSGYKREQNVNVVCVDCTGSGRQPAKDATCFVCNGTGTVTETDE